MIFIARAMLASFGEWLIDTIDWHKIKSDKLSRRLFNLAFWLSRLA